MISIYSDPFDFLDSSGTIDDITEMFGDDTQDGFAALSALDSNADSVMDINDTAFGDLRIWMNINQIASSAERYL